ncbi:MAG TPA: serine protease [Acidimicrobiales bacterium]|nr:serine protease [Acidimicrobiales bacterium]
MASSGGRARGAARTAGGETDTGTAGGEPGAIGGEGNGRRSAWQSLAARKVGRGDASKAMPLPTTRRGMFRYRVLPRSVLGVSMLILSFAVGAGFSGVVLYSYYQYKQNQADSRVNALVEGYKAQFAKAESDLSAAVAAAKADIAEQVKAAQALQAGPAQLAALVKQMAPSVFFVTTQDANGQPSVGTAFAVSSSASQTLLLTSYTTVSAATRAPGPAIYVQHDNGQKTRVTVRSWDPQYDLALLVLPRGGVPALSAAPSSPAPSPGDRVFAVSGLGSAGASLAQGSVVDVSAEGLAVDAQIGSAFQGGPVVNQSGEVIAVGSRTYSPLGFSSTGVWYVPYVEAACQQVLSCPGGTLVGSH